MTTGIGLMILGPWLVVAAAYIAPAVNQRGLDRSISFALAITLLGLGLTLPSFIFELLSLVKAL